MNAPPAVECSGSPDIRTSDSRNGNSSASRILSRTTFPRAQITDNMAGHFLKSGRIGAWWWAPPASPPTGDVANKIGTYSVAVLAKENATVQLSRSGTGSSDTRRHRCAHI
ncbi:MAG: hypothetical protein ABSG65_14175 [Bryobacteraceae bacterium]